MITHRRTQSGNAFLMVLIGVILFGALAFSFMRSGRQGMSNISTQEAGIAAGDTMAYARTIEAGISRMRVKGVSESDLDFVGASGSYDNAGCTVPKCEVFNAEGGQQVWQNYPARANAERNWVFTGAVSVENVGNDNGDAASADLMMVLPAMNQTVCREINNKLGIPNPSDAPPEAAASVDTSIKYTGTFTAGDSLSAPGLAGRTAGCYEDNGEYKFYQVLLAR